MKLTNKHLSAYLSYGLTLQISGEYIDDHESNGLRTWDMVGLVDKDVIVHKEGYIANIENEIEDCFPILRPLSDLGKTISINGVDIIPIEDMFDMLCPSNYVDHCWELINKKFQIDDEWNHVLSFDDDGETLEFSYGLGSFTLMSNDEVFLLSDQLSLFNKLFEWKFDIFGLIDQGLAIDKNTL